MAAPAIPPPTPVQFASLADAQAASSTGVMLSPATALALVQAHPFEILRAARQLLPTAPDGLNSGDPWINNNTLSYIP